MPVSDGGVALLLQGMSRKGVDAQVALHVGPGHVEEGVHLHHAPLPTHPAKATASARLLGANAGEPGGGRELAKGPVERLDLANPVVLLQRLRAVLLIELAVERLHSGGTEITLVDVELEPETLGETLRVTVGLNREIAGVDPDNRNPRYDRRGQMEQHRGLRPEARGHDQPPAVEPGGTLHTFQRTARRKLFAQIPRRSLHS